MMLHGIHLDPDCRDVQDTLQMVDISRSGMGAITDRWLYPGQRILLSLPLRSDGGRRNVAATVVRCHKVREGYHVGLEFDTQALGEATGYTAAVAA